MSKIKSIATNRFTITLYKVNDSYQIKWTVGPNSTVSSLFNDYLMAADNFDYIFSNLQGN